MLRDAIRDALRPCLRPITDPPLVGGMSWLPRDENGDPALIYADAAGNYWFDGEKYASFAAWAAAVGTVGISVSSSGTYRDASAARVQATEDVLRADHDASGSLIGWLLEGSSTNEYLNSDAPVSQVIPAGDNRTNISMRGSGSLALSGAYSGTVTEASPVYYDASGTLTVVPSGSVSYVQVEKNSGGRLPTSDIPTSGSSVWRAADSFTLSGIAGFASDRGTFLIAGRWSPHFNAIDQCALAVSDGTNANLVNVFRSSSGDIQAAAVYAASGYQSDGTTQAYAGQDFDIAISLGADGSVEAAFDGVPANMGGPKDTAVNVDRISIGAKHGSDNLGGHIARFAYFPRNVTNLGARNFYRAHADRVHGLGDSFMSSSFIAEMRGLLGKRIFTADGVGGSTLAEQLARYELTPALFDRVLVMTDDTAPLSDSPEDIADMLATYAELAGKVKNGRFLILEPGMPLGGVGGSSSRVVRDAKWAAICAAYPDNVVQVTAAMQASGDGSALDNDYIAADCWPGSCLVDPGTGPNDTGDGHLNAKGNAIYAQCAYDALVAKGW